MTVRARLGEMLDDAINPIVIKELRQAVRGRFVVTVITLSLVAQLIAVAVMVMTARINMADVNAQPVGNTAFMVLFTLLFTACIFFVPMYSGFRMAAERSDTNVDLLFITTIRARTIVLGKLMTALALVCLLFSTSLPFLIFSYVLRGIDFLSIAFVLAFALIIIATQTTVALFLACIPASKPFKLLLALALFIGTFTLYAPTLAVTNEVMRMGVAAVYQDKDAMTLTIVFSGATLTFDAVLLVVTTAMIMPAAANRALPVRLALAGLWCISAAGAAAVTVPARSVVPLGLWAAMQLGIITLVLMSAIGERETWGPRVARTIPAAGLRRAAAFLFYSGAAGGTLWALGLMIATIAFYFAAGARSTALDDYETIGIHLINAALCIAAYALTALLIRRTILARRVPPRLTWAIALLLFLVGAIVPPMIVFLRWTETPEFTLYFQAATVLNPFPPSLAPAAEWRTLILSIWAGIVVLANAEWMKRQARAFRPLYGGAPSGPLPLGEGGLERSEGPGEGELATTAVIE